MPSTKDVIDARPETIGTLLAFASNPSPIIIPPYQRLYQWDSSKVQDLLHITDPDSREFGFIGTMVFVTDKHGGLEVVDGQQRLLSLVIILCAFREYIDALSDNETDSAEARKLRDLSTDIKRENLLVTKSYDISLDSVRISFKRNTYDSFKNKYLYGDKEYISDEEVSKKELNNFDKNYNAVIAYLNEKYSHKKPDTTLLVKRLKKLQGLVINAIYITDSSYAGEVFESINGTGITLKLSELIKNYIFRSVEGPRVQERWDQIELMLGGKASSIERLIKYDWQNRHDVADDFEIFRSIKANTPQSDVNAYLDRLLRIAKVFNFYLNPNDQSFSSLRLKDMNNDKNQIIKHSLTLRTINAMQFLRVVSALHDLQKYIQIKDYERFLRLVQNFQVRAKITGIATNEIDRVYSATGKRLTSLKQAVQQDNLTERDVVNQLKEILFDDLKSEMKKFSNDEAFISSFRTYSRTRSSGKDFFKYILSTIENNLQRKELVIDWKDNQITLEEIYPQEPSKEWSTINLEAEDIYKLANATILIGKDNGAGSNFGIDKKLPIYKASNIKLNKEIVDVVSENSGIWDKHSVIIRSQRLADLAVEVWKLSI